MLLKDFYGFLSTITNNFATIDLYFENLRVGCFRYNHVAAHVDEAKNLLKYYGNYEIKNISFGGSDHQSTCEIYL